MIIRPDADCLLFITQPDHAGLAADLIARWRAGGFSSNPRRDDIILGARAHDNGWIEEDAATHTSANGEPLDFVTVPDAVKQRIWPRAIARLGVDQPYAAALVAEHALTVNSDHRSEPGWHPFFARVESLKSAALERCDCPEPARLADDYALLNIADLLSLVFCNGWSGPFEHEQRRITLAGATLRVKPDPFEGLRLPFRVPARRLSKRRFGSRAELRAALQDAPMVYLEGEAMGA
jgi:hypothetical protein